MHAPSDRHGVADATLECLVGFPTGTIGASEDVELLRILNALCKQHGYGRVPQMAQWISDIWRDPGTVAIFQRHQADLVRAIREVYPEAEGNDE